jgi:hypothetical protein
MNYLPRDPPDLSLPSSYDLGVMIWDALSSQNFCPKSPKGCICPEVVS